MQLLIATKNPGKFSEISEVLRSLPLELLSLRNLGIKDEVEEHGDTHEANAILKARYFYEKTGLPTLGEDSGIYVDAFPGELGVQTRRWEGLHHASDEEWVEYFLKKLEVFPKEKRTAKFVCAAALIFDSASFKKPHIFFGETHGIITPQLEAPLKAGIPISSCFRPEGCSKVYAALTAEEKNRVSHRGKAMHAVKNFLEQLLV
ncbi:non-canonical purine NTP pyrophosphatase [Candidatus Peregrinibacteria bacterium]|nr:non-canonical purine NTP pyrophosphatase [Candidatus Peregrinibacteria bacterium]